MKRTSSLLAGLTLLAVLPFTFTSCATSHLMRWSFGKSSNYREHDTEIGNSVLKPTVTVVTLPIAGVWDVVTLPFQMIWDVYPWGDKYLDPQHATAKRWIHHPRWVDAVQKQLDDAGWTDAAMKKQ
jgi:hypothetical protein